MRQAYDYWQDQPGIIDLALLRGSRGPWARGASLEQAGPRAEFFFYFDKSVFDDSSSIPSSRSFAGSDALCCRHKVLTRRRASWQRRRTRTDGRTTLATRRLGKTTGSDRLVHASDCLPKQTGRQREHTQRPALLDRIGRKRTSPIRALSRRWDVQHKYRSLG